MTIDPSLALTLLLVLAGVLIGGLLNGQRKDRCLSDFEGYEVTLERLDGQLIWGRLRLEGTGLELEYTSDVQDEYHIETTYLLYRDEFPTIQAVYRYCDEMDPRHWARRERELEESFHPGFWQQFRRRSRNFLNLASDSLGQAVSVLIGHVKAPGARYMTDASAKYLDSLGKNVIGYVGTKYDPLLERYVGTQVVVEVTEDNVVYEHVGVLKDYTAEFLEMLDVHYPNQAAFRLKGGQSDLTERHIHLTRDGDTLRVQNKGDFSLLVQHLHAGGGAAQAVNAVLDKNDELALHLPAGSTEEVEVEAKVIRHLDWILPRSHALIRHKAERYDPDQVFDIGFVLRLDRHRDEETRIRQAIEANPEDAASAVELGQILFQRGVLEEARRWYCYALDRRQHLRDGGKLAERQLRYIELKMAGRRSLLRRFKGDGEGQQTP